jgi:hypothetical protein
MRSYGTLLLQGQSLLPDMQQPRFVHNASGRFESRWVTVAIQEDSPAVMLKVGHTHELIVTSNSPCFQGKCDSVTNGESLGRRPYETPYLVKVQNRVGIWYVESGICT